MSTPTPYCPIQARQVQIFACILNHDDNHVYCSVTQFYDLLTAHHPEYGAALIECADPDDEGRGMFFLVGVDPDYAKLVERDGLTLELGQGLRLVVEAE